MGNWLSAIKQIHLNNLKAFYNMIMFGILLMNSDCEQVTRYIHIRFLNGYLQVEVKNIRRNLQEQI